MKTLTLFALLLTSAAFAYDDLKINFISNDELQGVAEVTYKAQNTSRFCTRIVISEGVRLKLPKKITTRIHARANTIIIPPTIGSSFCKYKPSQIRVGAEIPGTARANYLSEITSGTAESPNQQLKCQFYTASSTSQYKHLVACRGDIKRLHEDELTISLMRI